MRRNEYAPRNRAFRSQILVSVAVPSGGINISWNSGTTHDGENGVAVTSGVPATRKKGLLERYCRCTAMKKILKYYTSHLVQFARWDLSQNMHDSNKTQRTRSRIHATHTSISHKQTHLSERRQSLENFFHIRSGGVVSNLRGGWCMIKGYSRLRGPPKAVVQVKQPCPYRDARRGDLHIPRKRRNDGTIERKPHNYRQLRKCAVALYSLITGNSSLVSVFGECSYVNLHVQVKVERRYDMTAYSVHTPRAPDFEAQSGVAHSKGMKKENFSRQKVRTVRKSEQTYLCLFVRSLTRPSFVSGSGSS